MSAWDAIVIGGGHNGLVAGAYLARAGARTVVLEARSKTGGAAATDAPWPEAPEIRVTRLSYVMSLMPPRIIRELDLERHGYKLFPMGPAYQAGPDGRSLSLYDDDARRNHEQATSGSGWPRRASRPAPLEHGQVLGHGRAADRQGPGQLPDRPWPVARGQVARRRLPY